MDVGGVVLLVGQHLWVSAVSDSARRARPHLYWKARHAAIPTTDSFQILAFDAQGGNSLDESGLRGI
jgi:hypothetical protein